MRAAAGVVLCVACTSQTAGQQDDFVVHGEDDRRDYYQVDDERLRELTRASVAALVKDARLDLTNPDDVALVAPTLQEKENLCDGERFADQPAAASCSGTLIADDLVLTAGHCLRGDDPCAGIHFVFGYYYQAPGLLQRITTDDLFRCTEVVARFDGLTEDGRDLDHAVARLDRSATPRFAPVPIGGAPLSRGAPLAVISFASGVPAKIDAGGSVVDPRDPHRDFFLADSDTFVNSSGAGVFDRAGRELVGIVVRGPRDWVATSEGCMRVQICPDGCSGNYPYEEIGYARDALHHMCAVAPDPELCAL